MNEPDGTTLYGLIEGEAGAFWFDGDSAETRDELVFFVFLFGRVNVKDLGVFFRMHLQIFVNDAE